MKGKSDHLLGLKENVIIGKLIPAGSGLTQYRKYDVIPDEDARRGYNAVANAIQNDETVQEGLNEMFAPAEESVAAAVETEAAGEPETTVEE